MHLPSTSSAPATPQLWGSWVVPHLFADRCPFSDTCPKIITLGQFSRLVRSSNETANHHIHAKCCYPLHTAVNQSHAMSASRAALAEHVVGGPQEWNTGALLRGEGNGTTEEKYSSPKVISSHRQRAWIPGFPRSLRHLQQRSHRAQGSWRIPHPGHSAPESPGPCHTALTVHRFPRTQPAASAATWLLGLSVLAHCSFPFCSSLPKEPLGLSGDRAGVPERRSPVSPYLHSSAKAWKLSFLIFFSLSQ